MKNRCRILSSLAALALEVGASCNATHLLAPGSGAAVTSEFALLQRHGSVAHRAAAHTHGGHVRFALLLGKPMAQPGVARGPMCTCWGSPGGLNMGASARSRGLDAVVPNCGKSKGEEHSRSIPPADGSSELVRLKAWGKQGSAGSGKGSCCSGRCRLVSGGVPAASKMAADLSVLETVMQDLAVRQLQRLIMASH